jgi:hypothetical protein
VTVSSSLPTNPGITSGAGPVATPTGGGTVVPINTSGSTSANLTWP